MIRKTALTIASAAVLFVLLCASAMAAEVLQGACVSFDEDNHVIVVEEYDLNFDEEFRYGHPTGIQSEIDLKDALIGITPEAGDVVRIAYVVDGDQKVGIRVMNVSKQDLMKK